MHHRLYPDTSNRCDIFEPDFKDRHGLTDRFDRQDTGLKDWWDLPDMKDQCGGWEPDAGDSHNRMQPEMTNRLGPRLWNRHYPREPHVSGRGGKHRMTYKRGRSKSCSSFRRYSPDPVGDRRRRPDFSMRGARDRLEDDEGRDELSVSDACGRTDARAISESGMSGKHECSCICFWRIENFCIDETSPSCSINSQLFDVLMIHGSQWHLEVEHSQYESLILCLYRHGEKGCGDIQVELSVLTASGWNTVKDSIHNQFRSGSPCVGAKLINWGERLQVKARLPDDCLTVGCHISIQSVLFNPVQYFMPSRMISHKLVVHSPMLEFSDLNPSEVLNFPIQSIFLEHLPTPNELETKSTQTESTEYRDLFNDSEDLLKLFSEKTFCYVTLRTATKDFAVHKALLCAKSPVFNAMFREPMEENNTNIVNIEDIDGDCLGLLLQFFHLEPLHDLEWEDAAKLFYAADKYQVDVLKRECRSFLKKKFSNKNICDTFILADTHKDEDLRESAHEYFCANSKAILCSSEWTDFLFSRVDLASKVLYRLAQNM